MLALLLMLGATAQAENPWATYGLSAGAVAVSMPVAMWAGTKAGGAIGRQVPGIAIPVVIGTALPAGAAVASTWGYSGPIEHPVRTSAITWGIGMATYAGAVGLGRSTDEPKGLVVYGLANALLMPLPAVLDMGPGEVAIGYSDGMAVIHGTF